MWLLSGAVFPASGAPAWLQWVIAANPLSYGVGAVRWSMYGPEAYAGLSAPDPMVSIVVVVGFAAAMFGIALRVTLKS
jgi:ABC-2 type transport system permease protein